jgi:Domain of unknown function (DUF4157)
MGEYDKKPTKTKAAVTAGPAEDDRFGTGKIAEQLTARVIKYDIVGGMLRITIASGTTHGARTGMMGYLKVGADGALDFQILEAKEGLSYALLPDLAPEDIQGILHAVINPTSRPPQPAGEIPARAIAIEAIALGTRITISKGTAHGIVEGTAGRLRSKEGRGSFTVTRATLTRSYAIVHEPVDFVTANQELVLDRLPPKLRGGAVQRRASGAAVQAADVDATAHAGVAGATSPLPHHDTIQRAFGKHDVSGVRAQIGGPAAEASHALGAEAYATGNTVAFASAPDLHTAAHEAAHVVQQARGAVGFQGLGAADDEHERHADAVADAVVAGRSAEALLEVGAGSATTAVQRKEDTKLAEAFARSPFATPMRPVFDWRRHAPPRAMPESPQALDCAFDTEPDRAGPREHPASHVRQPPTHTEHDTAWPAIREVSRSVKSTHDDLVAEVTTYKAAHQDPTLKSFLYTEGVGSLAAVTDRQRSPERDGLPIASFFDEEGQLTIEPSTRGKVDRVDRPRASTGRAAAGTVEKSAALHAAVETFRAAVEGLQAARSDVEDVLHQIKAERAKNHAEEIREEIEDLQSEASEFKAAFDAAFAVLAGLAHVAAGEVGDSISKIGELAGTLLSRMNHRSIARLEVTLAIRERTIKSERGKSFAAMLDARKARVRQSTHVLASARSGVEIATAARSAAYKNLGRAAASELGVSEEEKRKVSAMISALPMIELVATRARSIASTPPPPAYSETAGHGLYLAVTSGDRHVSSFLRALGEIAGAREMYGRVANHWDRRLVQVRALANGVGSHAAE